MAGRDWSTPYARAMMVFLNGDAITEPGPRGEPVRDDTFLILLSANHEPVTFTLPGPKFGRCWSVALDTGRGPGPPRAARPSTGPAGRSCWPGTR